MEYTKEILLVTFSYALGCFCTGYYIVRLLVGVDIRQHNSGSAGARNVSRTLGKKGFIFTFCGDFFKGFAAVGAAKLFGLGGMGQLLCAAAVLAGHIWPIQLKFRGGKGVVTTAAALLVYDFILVAVMVGVFAVLYLIFRKYMLCGLIALASLVAAAFLTVRPIPERFAILAIVIIIMVAHRQNIAKLLKIRAASQ